MTVLTPRARRIVELAYPWLRRRVISFVVLIGNSFSRRCLQM